ncbi:MAG: CAP domain-containing protein [Candidatus Acidiferrales bacterium]
MAPWRFALILFLSAFIIYPASPQSPPNADQQMLLNLINQERARAGVPKLEWNAHLAESAHAHCRAMVEQGYIAHQYSGEPDLGGRIRATGLRFDSWGENVALAGAVADIHEALMNSPPHRANILSTKYNSVGVAILPRGSSLFAVENFANVYQPLSEMQFTNALVAAFNSARKSRKTFPVEVRPDDRLTRAACSETSDIDAVLHNQPGAVTLVMFSSSSPEKMPADMLEAAADPKLLRMNLGVCFRPGKEQGFASFRVVAAFYPFIHN